MTQTIEATFDGEVIRPDEPLAMKANTRVRLTLEALPAGADQAPSFLRTARSLNLEGPADWSANVDVYLQEEAHGSAG